MLTHAALLCGRTPTPTRTRNAAGGGGGGGGGVPRGAPVFLLGTLPYCPVPLQPHCSPTSVPLLGTLPSCPTAFPLLPPVPLQSPCSPPAGCGVGLPFLPYSYSPPLYCYYHYHCVCLLGASTGWLPIRIAL